MLALFVKAPTTLRPQLFIYERSAVLPQIPNILRTMVMVRFRTSLLVTR